MNQIVAKQLPLDEMLIGSFDQNSKAIARGDLAKVERMRHAAMEYFREHRFPDSTHEKWKNTEIENLTGEDFVQLLEPAAADRNM